MKIKNTLLFVMLNLFQQLTINAQTQLWGTCATGGATGQGTIFTADGNGNNFHKIYDFVNATGQYPWGNLTLANNGSLYGITEFGGFGDSCVCFKYNPTTGVYTNIHDFFYNMNLGWHAMSGMLNASDGNLYGLCSGGGTGTGNGVIYKIDPTTDTYSDIYNFTGASGTYPCGSLMQANDGNLYGFTCSGGANSGGVLFQYNPSSNVYSQLYNFSSSTGIYPDFGNLIQASDGKLYGTTDRGGANSLGVIFSYDISTNTYSDVYNFNLPAGVGSYNKCGVIQATDGLLYGTTTSSDSLLNFGLIYSFDINTSTFTNIHNFNFFDGAYPKRALKQGSNGKLYGTAMGGGIDSLGVAFSYDITTSTYTKLIDFDGTLGSNPDCEITETPAITVGITSLQPPPTVKIYPNPAVDFISIINTEKDDVIYFTDVLGRDLATVKIAAFAKSNVDITKFPNVFFVKSKDGVQKVVRK